MAIIGRVGNRYDPSPSALEPGRPRAELIAKLVSALSTISDVICELSDSEAMAAYRVAKARVVSTQDDMESEG